MKVGLCASGAFLLSDNKINVLYYMCVITISRITLNVCMDTT